MVIFTIPGSTGCENQPPEQISHDYSSQIILYFLLTALKLKHSCKVQPISTIFVPPERMHLCPRGPGWGPDGECLLGAVLSGAWYSA